MVGCLVALRVVKLAAWSVGMMERQTAGKKAARKAEQMVEALGCQTAAPWEFLLGKTTAEKWV